MMLKVLFLGNSEFCLPTLDILNTRTNLVGIVTGIDRTIVKRKKILHLPEPKIFAQQNNILCLQPSKMKDPDFLNKVTLLKPDIMIVLSYGFLLPPVLYNIAPFGCFNLHASLLPKYRGASPIQEALINKDSFTGITLQKINENIDEGDIYLQKKIAIEDGETYPYLRKKLSFLASEILSDFFDFYEKNSSFPPASKQKEEPSFCSKIKKDAGFIDILSMDAATIFAKYKAFYTWPQISIKFKEKRNIIKEMSLIETENKYPAGTIIQANKKGLFLQTVKDAIFIQKIQPENKKVLDFVSFINGYNVKEGDLFL